MAKIALVNPGRNPNFAVQEPLNLGFLASYLEKHNFEVVIIDELSGQNVNEEIDKFSPDILGITATTPLVHDAYRIAQMCRKKGILTVMGGVHASILPQEALQFVDLVVIGEGEEAILDIAKQKVTSRIITRPYIKNIDDIPMPARHYMQMDFYMITKDRLPNTYLYFVPHGTKTAAILSSRGCPYNCIFCHNTWRNLPYRYNSPKRVVEEIEHLIRNYKTEAIFFIEDNFFANKKRVIEICTLLKENKIKIIWGANARVDNIDIETLKIVKEAGCKQITFGFESGSQRILNILNKKTTLEQNKKAIEICKSVGIIPQGTIMIGNPTETFEDLEATRTFLKESDIESVGICITTPYPGTQLWKWCEEKTLIPKKMKWNNLLYDNIIVNCTNNISDKLLMRYKTELNWILEEKRLLKEKHYLKIYVKEKLKRYIKYPKSLLTTIFDFTNHKKRIKKIYLLFKFYRNADRK